MLELKKLFQREGEAGSSTEMDPGTTSVQEIRSEYLVCIHEVLSRAGIARECVDVEIRHLGARADGRPAFAAMLRLVSWERTSGLRLLLGLPMLERAARRLCGASWAGEVSHYNGLWVHPSGQILDRALLKDLGADLSALEGFHAAESQEPQWSVHADLESERKATDWGTA
ncbi:MAG: hypothetical protein NVS2B4_05100 [Ramlibacter sp.]